VGDEDAIDIHEMMVAGFRKLLLEEKECSLCGNHISDPPCGPTHAAQAALQRAEAEGTARLRRE
jgi:hypothetical protein